MHPVNANQARSDRMGHAFRPGLGYVAVGKLPMPSTIKAAASTAEPPAPAADNSLHFLNPPAGAEPMMMKWHPAQREWSPMLPGAGKRIGYSSAYLAAHGWHYLGPALER